MRFLIFITVMSLFGLTGCSQNPRTGASVELTFESGPYSHRFTQGQATDKSLVLSKSRRTVSFSDPKCNGLSITFEVAPGNSRGKELKVTGGRLYIKEAGHQIYSIESGQITFSEVSIESGMTDYDWETWVEVLAGDFDLKAQPIIEERAHGKTLTQPAGDPIAVRGDFRLTATAQPKKTAVIKLKPTWLINTEN